MQHWIHRPEIGPVTFGEGGEPPEGAVEVTAAEWMASVEALRQPPQIGLVELKAQLKASVDAAAEAERLKYITGGAGQAMTYARKVEQAHAAQANGNPQPGDYPLLDASVGIDGDDVLGVATVILAMDAAWEQIGAAIEAARLTTKRAIDEAQDEASARAVKPIWPLAV